MKHTSVKLNTPCEFINVVPVNPLISKCQIKVCYVGDDPNRNKSIITKDVARQMANSLPGSPIVGYYNENNGDFEEHNRLISLSNGQWTMQETTRPYGFVDLNAKVWFQKFLDDGTTEHEYLCTEGYIWTGAYPESQRIIDKGNNQSMELYEPTLNATWTKDDNGKPKFFIINEALIEKLCILGEDCEPCFEGSQIQVNFSLDDEFKSDMQNMISEMYKLIQEGGDKVFTTYAVEIGDLLWSSLYSYIESQYPDGDNLYCSIYRIDGIFEENGQKFAILQNRKTTKYYRLDFSLNEANGFDPSETLIEVTKSYTPAAEPQFALEAVEEFETDYASKKKAEEDKKGQDDQNKNDNHIDGENPDDQNNPPADDKKPEGNKPDDKQDDEDKKKKKYNLEEIVEYTELKAQFDDLQSRYSALETENSELKAQIEPLTQFKANVEKKDKEEMINRFYMLSDEDKADVITNIDKYSIDDIEAKLSVICVRNKVSFDLDENKKPGVTTFNLNSMDDNRDDMPAWVKAVLETEKKNQ